MKNLYVKALAGLLNLVVVLAVVSFVAGDTVYRERVRHWLMPFV